MDAHSHKSGGSAQFGGTAAPIPHRTHSHRGEEPSRTVGNQPDPLVRLFRLATSVGLSALLMLVAMVGAMKYLQRDWADKNQRARSGGGVAAAAPRQPAQDPARTEGDGIQWRIPEDARERFLASLGGGERAGHVWLVQGFAGRMAPGERQRAALLDLAEHGDSVQFRNLHAALLLRHGDVLQAARQLRSAERLEPGYAPTLFNRALCALLSDLPEKALVWLARYRARCPEDVQAMRLQFNLLVQLDRADEAMDTLGAYLAKQPPTHPLLLDAAIQAAQMNRVSDAIRYLEIAQKGQAPMVIARIYQSPAFREIRLSPEGTAFAERLAKRARAALARSSAVHAKVEASPSAPRIPVNPKFH